MPWSSLAAFQHSQPPSRSFVNVPRRSPWLRGNYDQSLVIDQIIAGVAGSVASAGVISTVRTTSSNRSRSLDVPSAFQFGKILSGCWIVGSCWDHHGILGAKAYDASKPDDLVVSLHQHCIAQSRANSGKPRGKANQLQQLRIMESFLPRSIIAVQVPRMRVVDLSREAGSLCHIPSRYRPVHPNTCDGTSSALLQRQKTRRELLQVQTGQNAVSLQSSKFSKSLMRCDLSPRFKIFGAGLNCSTLRRDRKFS